MNSDIEQLKKDVDDLKIWKEQRTRQQITYPLDQQSLLALGKYFLSSVFTFITSGGASGNSFGNLVVKQDNKYSAISTFHSLIVCTADAASDKYTLGGDLVSGAQGALVDDMFVTVFAPDPGSTPTGITNGNGYFIVGASGNTVQLSASKGGSAINFTTNGVGPQYIAL